MSDRRAIIDIGSNTVRLVVYNGPPRAPVTLHNEKVNARLGRDLGKTGAIPDKALRLALTALERYAALLHLLDVAHVNCVATAAARDASNGPQFIASVRALGLSPRVLTGEEEARASATGVLAAFPGAKGVAADIGGGSLELVEIDGGIRPGGVTLPFGTLRLPDLRARGAVPFGAAVRAGLKKAGWNKGEGLPLYIVGGSWRALALQAMRDLDWPVDDPHGFELPAETALRLARRYAKGRPPHPDPRISSSRLASLPDAAALMAQMILRLRPSHLVFSSWGLREGLLHAALPQHVQDEDPLLAGVAAFADPAFVSLDRARAIAQWTAPACADKRQDGSMRIAATLLAMSAMRNEPNMRTEEAMTWALRKRWIGLDMHGRAMLAMTVFANSGQTQAPDAFLRLATQEDLDRAIVWGLAVRLCRRLTTGNPAAMAQCQLERRGTALVLTLADGMRPLYSASLAKDLKALSERLGLGWRALDARGVSLG